jgi:hypothetical protein
MQLQNLLTTLASNVRVIFDSNIAYSLKNI